MVKTRVIDRLDFAQWAHMRLSTLVTAGREDLRHLRNRFGMEIQGKLIHASALTEKEREDALYHIQND
jgi:hypothetical protein